MGLRLKYVIVESHTSSHYDDKEDDNMVKVPDEPKVEPEVEYSPKKHLLSEKVYHEYIKEHGHHFTETLAEYACKMMVNANETSHIWSSSQIKKSFDNLGLSIPSKVTLGDITYAANMAYADFYPEVLKEEASCIKYAYRLANDPDGYEGMIFDRWVTDTKGKSLKVEWEEFV